MQYFLVLICIACAFSMPANEKRFFGGLFGNDETTTTQNPELEKLKNIKGDIEEFEHHIKNHHRNFTNSTNDSFEKIGQALVKLNKEAGDDFNKAMDSMKDLDKTFAKEMEEAMTVVVKEQEGFEEASKNLGNHYDGHIEKVKANLNE